MWRKCLWPYLYHSALSDSDCVSFVSFLRLCLSQIIDGVYRAVGHGSGNNHERSRRGGAGSSSRSPDMDDDYLASAGAAGPGSGRGSGGPGVGAGASAGKGAGREQNRWSAADEEEVDDGVEEDIQEVCAAGLLLVPGGDVVVGGMVGCCGCGPHHYSGAYRLTTVCCLSVCSV